MCFLPKSKSNFCFGSGSEIGFMLTTNFCSICSRSGSENGNPGLWSLFGHSRAKVAPSATTLRLPDHPKQPLLRFTSMSAALRAWVQLGYPKFTGLDGFGIEHAQAFNHCVVMLNHRHYRLYKEQTASNSSNFSSSMLDMQHCQRWTSSQCLTFRHSESPSYRAVQPNGDNFQDFPSYRPPVITVFPWFSYVFFYGFSHPKTSQIWLQGRAWCPEPAFNVYSN